MTYGKMSRNIDNYDLNEIGSVSFRLNFDDDYYMEYINDNELEDSQNSKLSFIKDCCDYDTEFTDSETFHHLGYDTMTFDEIESYFGSSLANDVLNDCMDGNEHSYEPLSYENENFNLNDPQELSNAAMKYLRYGDYYRNARGFILPNGVIVYTELEHSHCTKIPGVTGTFHFIQLGCIRILDHSIDLAKPPTREQETTLYKILRYYYTEELYLDLRNEELGNFSKKYSSCEPAKVMSDIKRYFSGQIPKETKFEIDEAKIKKVVSEVLRNVLKKRLNEN